MIKILEENKEVSKTVLEYSAEKCQSRLWHSRKIRGEEIVHQRAMFIVACAIKQFNAMEPRVDIVPGWNVHVSKVNIYVPLKDCVNPEEIRKEPLSMYYADILDRPEFTNDWTFTFKFKVSTKDKDTGLVITKDETEKIIITQDVYNNAIADLNRHEKKGAYDNTMLLSDLRKPCSISDIEARICVDNKVHYMGNPFIPIDINVDFKGIYNSSYWNANAKEVIDDYWLDKAF